MEEKIMFLGRKKELDDLNGTLLRGNVLCSVIGRRGVGKTRLMNYFIESLDKNDYMSLRFCGNKLSSTKVLINSFLYELSSQRVIDDNELSYVLKFGEWSSVFKTLNNKILEILKYKKVVIFIDEFAWFHKRGSNFLGAFTEFWNNVMSLNGVYIYISGSSLIWLDENVVNTKGGLHGRVEKKIYLQPFTFLETAGYLRHVNSLWGLEDYVRYYFYTGGVPRYLKRIRGNFSEVQNLEEIFAFDDEYQDLFKSTFESNKNIHMSVINLFEKRHSLKNDEIIKMIKDVYGYSIPSIYSALNDLIVSGFLKEVVNQNNRKEKTYFLIDLFCFSYLKLIKEKKYKQEHRKDIMFGYAFEILALKNTDMILTEMKRLMEYHTYSWQNKDAQIDFLIENANNPKEYLAVEVKHYNDVFEINNEYNEKIKNKLTAFKDFKKVKKKNISIEFVFFSLYGVKKKQIEQNLQYQNIILEKILKDYFRLLN